LAVVEWIENALIPSFFQSLSILPRGRIEFHNEFYPAPLNLSETSMSQYH